MGRSLSYQSFFVIFQGLIHGPVDQSRKMTETVECQGNEAKLEDCQIKYKTNHGVCKPEQSIVSVTCVHDTFASCEDNEVPWKQKCYSVYFNRSSFEEAGLTCKKEGKQLVELTDQDENDFLSELLFHSSYSQGLLSEIWTGGKARKNGRRSATYFWSQSLTGIDCKNTQFFYSNEI